MPERMHILLCDDARRGCKNAALHDPFSPLLIGRPSPSDEIRERSLRPQRMDQLSLFEAE